MVSVGSGNTFNAGSLTANTLYYFFVIAYNSGSCPINYYTTSPLTTSGYTSCSSPTAQPTSLLLTSASTTSITGSFTTEATANGYIIIRSTSSTLSGDPVDGTTYTAGNSLGGGTVVQVGSGSSFTASSLTANTLYYFFVYSYNNGGTCAINYYTGAASLTGSQTTQSNLSDIVAVASSEANTISSLLNDAAPLSSTTGTQVWQITVRDGGSAMSDNDNLPTIVNAFNIAQVGNTVDNWSDAIKTAALFDGATLLATATVTSTQIQFSGLTVTVSDNSSKTLSLRLSLNCGIGSSNFDGEHFGFSLSNGNLTLASSGSSQKTTFSAATSSTTKNVIAVVSTKLVFTQQPTSTGTATSMSPSVIVSATDACGNVDVDFTGNVSITSTGTLTGTPVIVAASSGVATFSSLIHTVAATGLTITATATGLTSITSTTFDITQTTIFGVGDIIIVGMAVNVDDCGGVSGEDEISFVSFEDITPGTTIDITDNGYQRVDCTSDEWGNTEGVVRITRTTSTIPKGTVVTLRILDATIFSAIQPDANWTVSYPNAGYGTFNLNGTDEQVYIMQGGTWNKGGSGNHDATYTGGTLMFAINTYTSWTCNNNLTTRGDLPLSLKCFSILPGIASPNIKYTGPTSAATQKDWVDRLNTAANWTGSTTCGDYIADGRNYTDSSITYVINAGGFAAGTWTGATNTDWYDCNNWQNFKVPDSTVNVAIDNQANDPVIGAPTALYPNGAICNSLTLSSGGGGAVLTLNNAASYLSIKGNLTNNGTITGTLGTVEFRSSSNQTISGTGTTSLYSMKLRNTGSTGVSMSKDITLANTLTFVSGILSTGSNKLVITNTTTPTISGYTSTAFINGNLRQHIGTNTFTYVFPMGNGTTSSDYKRIDLVNNNLTGITYIDGYVKAITESSPEDDATFASANVTQNSQPLTTIYESAIWDLTPNAAATGGSYGVRLYALNTGLSSNQDNKFCVVKRASSSTTFADWATVEGSTTIPADNAAGRVYNNGNGYAERLGYTTFSMFGVALSPVPLPIKLLSFKALANRNTVDLSWSTSSEINNDRFEIERSIDGKEFEFVKKIKGAGSSSSLLKYHMVDFEPYSGTSFYRLKQVDYNGLSSYSNVEKVNFKEVGKSLSVDLISMNGTKGLNVRNAKSSKIKVEAIDMLGHVLSSREYDLNDGTIMLDDMNISTSMYFIRVSDGFEVAVKKLY